jgi:hypothetical protein
MFNAKSCAKRREKALAKEEKRIFKSILKEIKRSSKEGGSLSYFYTEQEMAVIKNNLQKLEALGFKVKEDRISIYSNKMMIISW